MNCEYHWRIHFDFFNGDHYLQMLKMWLVLLNEQERKPVYFTENGAQQTY
jgi:hypothetical protein